MTTDVYEVVGLEGRIALDGLFAWGAAAIRSGDTVRNSLSGVRVPASQADELRDRGDITYFPEALPIEPAMARAPLIGLIVTLPSEIAKRYFRVDPGREGAVIAHRHNKDYLFSVFQNRALFDVYAESATKKVLRDLFNNKVATSDLTSELLQWSLALTPAHPALNALRVHHAPHPHIMERFARAALRTPVAREEFERLLDALRGTASEASWELRYDGEKGMTAGGGLDMADAITMHTRIQVAQAHVIPFVKDRFDYLPRSAGGRLVGFKAASATVKLASTIKEKEQTLGDKVARYLTMYWVQQMLRGNMPPIEETRALHEALDGLVAPDEYTTVTQTPLRASNPEIVAPQLDFTPKDVEDERVVQVIGTVSGFSRGSRLELALSPDRVVIVSTADNGQGLGERPQGVDAIEQRADFLRRPALATLLRRTGDEIEHFHLQSLTLLRDGVKGFVDTMPSTLVRGAYVRSTEPMPVQGRATGCRIDGLGDLAAPNQSVAGERQWLQDLKGMTGLFESQQPAMPSGWLPPAAGFKPSARDRILLALVAHKGRATLNEVITFIQTRFEGAVVRANNTQREVRSNDDWLSFAPDDASVVVWTSNGERLARILNAIHARERG